MTLNKPDPVLPDVEAPVYLELVWSNQQPPVKYVRADRSLSAHAPLLEPRPLRELIAEGHEQFWIWEESTICPSYSLGVLDGGGVYFHKNRYITLAGWFENSLAIPIEKPQSL